MKRGRKPPSPAMVAMRNETRAERQVVHLYPDIAARPDPEHIPPPEGMSWEAELIWQEKIDVYKQRGQKIQGFEAALRAYCELEAALHKSFAEGTINVTQVNAHRAWANEFYDTPASQRISLRTASPVANKFGSNGQRKTGS